MTGNFAFAGRPQDGTPAPRDYRHAIRRHARRRARGIAAAAIDGEWTRDALAERLAEHACPDPADADELACRLLEHCPAGPPATTDDLARLVLALPPKPSEPDPGPAIRPHWPWPVPRWERASELATALDLRIGELEWLSDARGWNRHARPVLRHYRTHWMRSSTGGARLIEQPKPRLAELQRRLARHLLTGLPVHDAAHGFRRGRSAASFAAPHAGQAIVVHLDLEGFFASITGERVRALLRTAGYDPSVAALLTGLLCTATPADVLRTAPRHGDPAVRDRLLARLRGPHLAQGAPSSPALANALAHRLDRRLAGLAGALGANYTRYADDLAFSGPSALPLHRLLSGVRRIAEDEGFRLRPDKTRIRGAHQRQRLAGLVVNAAPAVPRWEYDELRAILHNCARTGPRAQNHDGHPDFRAHLLGKIGWAGAGNPARAAKLRALFDRIQW